MTAEEIRGTVDTRLVGRWSEIQQAQAGYHATHGRYAQGLLTHSSIPADGVEAAPDRKHAKPTDQAESWEQLSNLPATMMSALRLDVYDGPEGVGYVVVVGVRIGGRLWQKRINVGPETWRAHGWREVVE